MCLTRDDRPMRVEAGAVVDEFDLSGIGQVVARHTRIRTPDGGVTWSCIFTVVAAGVSDLSVVHRLSAPSLAEGRRSVRHAVEFLAGRGIAPLPPERRSDGDVRQGDVAPLGPLPAGQTRVGSMHPARRATDFRPLVDSLPRTPAFELPPGVPAAPADATSSRDDLDPVPAPLS